MERNYSGGHQSWLEVDLLPPLDLLEESHVPNDQHLSNSDPGNPEDHRSDSENSNLGPEHSRSGPSGLTNSGQAESQDRQVAEILNSDSDESEEYDCEEGLVIDEEDLQLDSEVLVSTLLNTIIDSVVEQGVSFSGELSKTVSFGEKFQNLVMSVEILDSVIKTAVQQSETNQGILKKPFRSPKKYRPRLKRFSIPRSIIASSTHPTPLQPSTSSANKTLEAELIQDVTLGNTIESTINDEYSSANVENVESFWSCSNGDGSKDDDSSCQWLVTEVRSLSNHNTENVTENYENLTGDAENSAENDENSAETSENITDQSSGSTLFLPSSGRFSGKRKVAKVMPYSGPYEEAYLEEGDQDLGEDPLAITSDEQLQPPRPAAHGEEEDLSRIVELVDELENEQLDAQNVADVHPVSSGLRLKSFATLMASPPSHNATSSAPQSTGDNSMAASTSATSWFKAPSEPPPPSPAPARASSPQNATARQRYNPTGTNKTSFEHADQELNLTYMLNVAGSSEQKRYHIFTTTSLIFLKLFVSDKIVSQLPKQASEWKEVNVSFWPSRSSPSHVKLLFNTPSLNSIVANLPPSNDAANNLVKLDTDYFALSCGRVKDINQTFYSKFTKPFISHALRTDNTVMFIDFDKKDKPYAQPLFLHLEDNYCPIDSKMRHKTRGHIALSFHHHNVSRVDANSIENIIFEKSTIKDPLPLTDPKTYRHLVLKSVEMEIKRKTNVVQQQQPPQQKQPQQAVLPQTANTDVSNFNAFHQQLPLQQQQQQFHFQNNVPIMQAPAVQMTGTFQMAPQQQQQFGFANNSFQQQQQPFQQPQQQQQQFQQPQQQAVNFNSQVQQNYQVPIGTNTFQIGQQVSLNSFQMPQQPVQMADPPPDYSETMAVQNTDQSLSTPIITSVTGNVPGVAASFVVSDSGSVVRIDKNRAVEKNRGFGVIVHPPSAPQGRVRCRLCVNFFLSDQRLLLSHLTDAHFRAAIAMTLAPGTKVCPIPRCVLTFPSKELLTHHIGVDHQKSLEFYRGLDVALEAFGKMDTKMFKCTFTSCGSGAMAANEFLIHLHSSHFACNLKTEISNIQAALGKQWTECPVDNCGCTFTTHHDLEKHYAVEHCLVLDHYMINIRGSPAGNALTAYRKALGIEEEFVCDLKTATGICGFAFSFRTAWLYHLSMNHYHEKLVNLFKNRSHQTVPPELNSLDSRVCSYCQKSFQPQTGAIHLGVDHKVAQMMVEAFNKASSNSGPVAQPNVAAPATSVVVSTYPAKVNPVQPVMTSKPSRFMPVFATTSIPENPLQTVQPAKPIPRVAVQPAKLITSPPVAQEDTTTQNENSENEGYYQCPDCPNTFIGGLNFRVDSLATHIAAEHMYLKFEMFILQKKPVCPAKCGSQSLNIGDMAQHFLKQHPIIVTDFIKTQREGFSFSSCFIKKNKQEEDKVVLDLFEGYKTFCFGRNIDSRKCDVSWINVYLNFSFNKHKPDPEKMLKVVELVANWHTKLPTGESILEHKLIQQFKSKIQPLQPPQQQQKQAQSSTVETSSSAAVSQIKPSSLVQPIDMTNTHNFYACFSCNLEFPSVMKLILHAKHTEHSSEGNIGCKFCDEHYIVQSDQVGWAKHAETILVLHTFGSDHMFNRWFYKFSPKTNLKVRKSSHGQMSNSVTGTNRCEACSKEVPNLHEHTSTKQHLDNTYIINQFVAHCDLRAICPITCSVEELIFYFNYIFPKTKQNKQNKIKVNIHQVLLVLSRIHDPIDGMDISGHSDIEDHITDLLSTSGHVKPVPHYVCYKCPHWTSDFESFIKHLKDCQHFQKCSETSGSQQSSKCLRCDPCDATFPNFTSFNLHSYSKDHLHSAFVYGNTPDLPPSCKTHFSCPMFCYLCMKEIQGLSHIVEFSHSRQEACANLYLNFCNKNSLNPTTAREPQIKSFFAQTFTSDKKSPQDPGLMLSVVAKLHEPIDGYGLADHPFYKKIVENLIVLQNPPQKSDEDSSSSLASTASSSSNKAFVVKNGPHHYSSLSPDDLQTVTQCPLCHLKFTHATYLVYHMAHLHKKSSEEFLGPLTRTANLKNCPKCMKKCFTPIVLALHHDRHHLAKPLECPSCRKNFLSPAAFYREDRCRKNALPDVVKLRSEQAIKDVVQMNRKTFVIGEPSQEKRKSSSDDEDDDIVPRSTKRSRIINTSSSSSDDNNSSDEHEPRGEPNKRDDCFGIAARNRKKEDYLINNDAKLKMRATVKLTAIDRNVAEQAQKMEKKVCGSTFGQEQFKQGIKLHIKILKSEIEESKLSSKITEPKIEVKPRKLRRSTASSDGSKDPVKPVQTISDVKIQLEPGPVQIPVRELRHSQTRTEAQSTIPKGKKCGPLTSKSLKETLETALPSTSKESDTSSPDLKRKLEEVAGQVPEPKRLRSDFKPSPKSKSAASKISSSSPKQPILSQATTSKPLPKKDLPPQAGFCLECEDCPTKNCDHLNHGRKIHDDLAKHAVDSGHKRFQMVKDFKMAKCKVRLLELSLSQFYGHKVRKQFKKYVKSVKEKDVFWHYGRERNCKSSDCHFKTVSVVDMFRHIREVHLNVTDED